MVARVQLNGLVRAPCVCGRVSRASCLMSQLAAIKPATTILRTSEYLAMALVQSRALKKALPSLQETPTAAAGGGGVTTTNREQTCANANMDLHTQKRHRQTCPVTSRARRTLSMRRHVLQP